MSGLSVNSLAALVAGISMGDGANMTPVCLVRFTTKILDLLVDILDEEERDRATLKQGLEFPSQRTQMGA